MIRRCARLTKPLGTVGLRAQAFKTAQEFLGTKRPDTPSRLVLDVRLPGLSGLDLQRELAHSDPPTQIVFVTAHSDVPMTVQALKAGAVDFLTKPFRDQEFIDAVQQAIDRDRATRHQQRQVTELRRRYESLTPREREVMARVVTGLLNKQIAADLHTSEATVKAHRAQVMHKMEATSVAQLGRAVSRDRGKAWPSSPSALVSLNQGRILRNEGRFSQPKAGPPMVSQAYDSE
jgi:FixJ family two-component response regulator